MSYRRGLTLLSAAAVSLCACAGADEGASTKQQRQDACLSDAGLDPRQPRYDEILPDSVCTCIVASDERPFAESRDWSDVPVSQPDTRSDEPEYELWRGEVRRTRCGCCHNTDFRGPGTPYWDVTFEPVWTDSVSDARLRTMAGEGERPGQTLPLPDAGPFRVFVENELLRRQAARAN